MMTVIQKHRLALDMLANGFGWEDIRLKLNIPEVTVKGWIVRWRADGTLAKIFAR